MKGIAILGIMLHNYCHYVKGIVRENEFTWQQMRCDRLWDVIQQPDELLPMHLFSFFGHYGVTVFLFLSGFGLVMKYEHETSPDPSEGGECLADRDSGRPSSPLGRLRGVWRFLRYNYLKLFRIFIVGFVLFVMLDAITPGMHRYKAHEVVAMLGMYANFLERPSQVIWPGPYWYFSVTLQLYILYRLVFYRWRHWGVVVALMVGCWVWQLCYLDDMVTLERLRYNLVGGLLPFGMGVLCGRFLRKEESGKGKENTHAIGSPTKTNLLLLSTFLFSLFIAIPMSFDINTWLWVPALAVVGTIALVKLIPQWLMPPILWLGTISAAIFVMHPLVRKIFVRPYLVYDQYTGLLLFVVATLLVSWHVNKIINQIPKPTL